MSNVIKRQSVLSKSQRLIHQPVASSENVDHDSNLVTVSYEEEWLERQNQLTLLEKRLMEEHESRLAQLEEEKLRTLEAATLQGYEAGFVEGQSSGFATYDKAMSDLNALSEKLEQRFQEKLMMMEHDLCVVALQTTHLFLENLLDSDEETLYKMIHKLLIQFRDREKLFVYASPQDFERLVMMEDKIQSILGATVSVQLRLDPELSPRDFRIDSENGAITGGLHSSFKHLEKKIFEVLTDV
ncbi:FliH/SctL family protein [Exiguobacterium sp. A1_3_1]|uniref:FliH/SctL family protein n=1 Tax=Exiguobacterium sp. A1_3_1 TaxID=2651871 RepID=UPI003B9858F9